MSKDNDRILVGQLLDESAWLEMDEFCTRLHVEQSWVVRLVDAGVLEPRGREPTAWSFPATALARARATVRLIEDLGVNLEAAGIILDLLEERRELEFRLRQLEQLLG
jgi:chaperone modulatory protein CbpM